MKQNYAELDSCIEEFDLIFCRLFKRLLHSDAVRLFLLRHYIISDYQIHSLAEFSNLSCRSTQNFISSEIKRGYVRRSIDANGEVTYSMTPSGKKAAINVFVFECENYEADGLMLLPFKTSEGEKRHTFRQIAETVANSNVGAKGKTHHSAAVRDLYVYFLKSNAFFTFDSETIIEEGRIYSVSEKKSSTGFLGGSRKVNVWADAIYSLSDGNGSVSTQLLLEQDCGTESAKVIEEKLDNYDLNFFSSILKIDKKRLLDFILCFSVGYPVLVHKRRLESDSPTGMEAAKLTDCGTLACSLLGKKAEELTNAELADILKRADADRFGDTIALLRRLDREWGRVSVQAYTSNSRRNADYESLGNAQNRVSSIRRRALTGAHMDDYADYYARGLSVISIDNMDYAQLSSVMTEINETGRKVLSLIFGYDIPYEYSSLRLLKLGASGNAVCAFRNCYRTENGIVVIENPTIDLGARARYNWLKETGGANGFIYVFLFRRGTKVPDIETEVLDNVLYYSYEDIGSIQADDEPPQSQNSPV